MDGESDRPHKNDLVLILIMSSVTTQNSDSVDRDSAIILEIKALFEHQFKYLIQTGACCGYKEACISFASVQEVPSIPTESLDQYIQRVSEITFGKWKDYSVSFLEKNKDKKLEEYPELVDTRELVRLTGVRLFCCLDYFDELPDFEDDILDLFLDLIIGNKDPMDYRK